MPSLNDARAAVYQRFIDNYTGVTADRITFENEEFNEPKDGQWVRVTVRSLERDQDTLGQIGNRKFRALATVIVQVYTRPDTGLQTADALAKEAADLYDGVSFSGLDFRAAVVRESGISGNWNQFLMESDFQFDEIK